MKLKTKWTISTGTTGEGKKKAPSPNRGRYKLQYFFKRKINRPDDTVKQSEKSSKIVNPNELNGLDIDPALAGVFEPDVRPFEWPKRKLKRGPKLVQLELFGDEQYEWNEWNW